MNRDELMKTIKEKGVWMINSTGCYLKAWEENEQIIIRAYNRDLNGGWITETYKRKENDVIITENQGKLTLSLTDEWVDNVNETACASDRQADYEYSSGTINAVYVENNLASVCGIETFDEVIFPCGLLRAKVSGLS